MRLKQGAHQTIRHWPILIIASLGCVSLFVYFNHSAIFKPIGPQNSLTNTAIFVCLAFAAIYISHTCLKFIFSSLRHLFQERESKRRSQHKLEISSLFTDTVMTKTTETAPIDMAKPDKIQDFSDPSQNTDGFKDINHNRNEAVSQNLSHSFQSFIPPRQSSATLSPSQSTFALAADQTFILMPRLDALKSTQSKTKRAIWQGGKPRLPEDFIWPSRLQKAHGTSLLLHFVAQIDCSELPNAARGNNSKAQQGSLVIFADLNGDKPALHIRHLAQASSSYAERDIPNNCPAIRNRDKNWTHIPHNQLPRLKLEAHSMSAKFDNLSTDQIAKDLRLDPEGDYRQLLKLILAPSWHKTAATVPSYQLFTSCYLKTLIGWLGQMETHAHYEEHYSPFKSLALRCELIVRRLDGFTAFASARSVIGDSLEQINHDLQLLVQDPNRLSTLFRSYHNEALTELRNQIWILLSEEKFTQLDDNLCALLINFIAPVTYHYDIVAGQAGLHYRGAIQIGHVMDEAPLALTGRFENDLPISISHQGLLGLNGHDQQRFQTDDSSSQAA